MSDTPIFDSVADELDPPAGTPAEDVAADPSPVAYEEPAEEDPDPVLNDDADDDLADVEDGEDDGDGDLEDTDPEVDPDGGVANPGAGGGVAEETGGLEPAGSDGAEVSGA